MHSMTYVLYNIYVLQPSIETFCTYIYMDTSSHMQCILGVLPSYNSLLYRGRQEIDDCRGSDKLVASNTRCHELNATYKLIIDSLFHIMTVLLAIVILAFIIHNYYTHDHPTGPL